MSLQYTTSYAAETEKLSLPVYAVPAASLTVTSDGADSVQESLISAPLYAPESWEFAKKDIGNVYSDTTVPSSARPTTSRGVQIMVKHNSYVTVTKTDDAEFVKTLPMVSWTCVRIPINEYMTSDLVLDEVQRMAGGLLEESVSSSRIAELIRGALKAQ